MFIWDFSFFLTIFRPNRQNKQRPESPLLKQHRSMPNKRKQTKTSFQNPR